MFCKMFFPEEFQCLNGSTITRIDNIVRIVRIGNSSFDIYKKKFEDSKGVIRVIFMLYWHWKYC